MKNNQDFSREGINIEKLINLLRLLRPKNTRTLIRLNKFTDLNIEGLSKLTGRPILGIISDVDDCIAPNHGNILPENLIHIKNLHSQGIQTVLFSNAKKTQRYDEIEQYAHVLTNIPPKPNLKGYRVALEQMNLDPTQVVMVGDNYITDAGCLKLGIPFVHIEPIKDRSKNNLQRIAMKIYSLLRGFYIWVSKIHEKFFS